MIGAWPESPARPASLDTGQQNDISDAERHDRILVRDLERLQRNDRAKGRLSGLVDQAAVDRSAWDPDGAAALERMARKLDACRTGQAYRDAACGAYLFRPASCHVRLCPDDERARGARLVGRFAELAGAMRAPKFWTFTVPNVPAGALERGVDILLDALAHLRKRAIVAGGPCPGAHRGVALTDVGTGIHQRASEEVAPCAHPPHRRELAAVGACRCARCLEVDVVRGGSRVTVNGCPRCGHDGVAGGVYSIEVTWSKDRRDWHPHAHALIDAPWIRQSEMRDAWRAVTCDATRRAELRATGAPGRVPRCPHRADARGRPLEGCRGASIVWVEAVRGEPGSDDRRRAVAETLKYVSKGLLDEKGAFLPGAGPAELGELLLALRGRRLVAGWGTFRNVTDAEDDALDPAQVFVGAEVPTYMVGLPRICPNCHGPALWDWPVGIPRAACRPIGHGVYVWRPPVPPARA
jgi:hypothetical protein